ncbi:MAG: type II secretion system F family protein, partial [Candidatus Riflebacteria bacterium]|nr:type II secretion system F family protein [Candidatus Riflebacteria bacterium]
MPTFKFTGQDASGKPITDTINAENSTIARSKLMTQKISVQTLEEVQAAGAGKGGFFERVSFQEQMTFYSALSIAINAGASLREALGAFGEQTANPKLRRILIDIIRCIEGGKSFSDALRRHTDLFPNDFISLVAAGEKAGNMAEMLRDYVVYAEKQAKIRSKAIGAMIYPLVMIAVAVVVVLVLTTVIFPKFIQSFGVPLEQLPTITQYVQLFSNVLIEYWLYLVFGVPALIFLLSYLAKNTAGGRKTADWLSFNLPVFGNLMKKFYISRFVHVLGAQLKGGVPGLSALLVTREVTANSYFQQIVDDIIDSIKSGGTYTQPLRKYPHIIPPIVALMFSIGERSGAIGEVLEKIGNYYDDLVATATEVLVSLIEPIMIVVMGVLVSIIAVSMFLPIFNLTK